MKNKISIECFEVLDIIASRHDIKDEAWAKAAKEYDKKFHRPRISELRSILKKHKKSGNVGKKPGFAAHKAKILYMGLEKILGAKVTKEEFLKEVNKIKDPVERITFLCNAIGPDEASDIEKIMIMSIKSHLND